MNFTKITRLGGKVILFGKKHAPEILMGVGVVSTVAGTVFACKATLKVDDILDEHKDTMIRIKNTYEKSKNGDLKRGEEPYTAKDKQRATVKLYAGTTVKMARNYGPAIALTATGIGCMLGACGMYRSLYLGAAAAYTALDDQFNKYRERVRLDRGEVKDQEYMYGLKAQEFVTVGTEEDSEKVVTETVLTVPDEKSFDDYVKENGFSPYARIFDSCNPNFTNDPVANRYFLNSVQEYANRKLNTFGYVFLDDVLKDAGFPVTKASKQVGWLKGKGDGEVKFNIIQPYNSRFVNGYEPTCVVDFNVDGIILYDAPIENI